MQVVPADAGKALQCKYLLALLASSRCGYWLFYFIPFICSLNEMSSISNSARQNRRWPCGKSISKRPTGKTTTFMSAYSPICRGVGMRWSLNRYSIRMLSWNQAPAHWWTVVTGKNFISSSFLIAKVLREHCTNCRLHFDKKKPPHERGGYDKCSWFRSSLRANSQHLGCVISWRI